MKIINQSIELLDDDLYDYLLYKTEMSARNCYQSKSKEFLKEQSEKFISNLIKRGHESPLEQCSLMFRIVTDRAVLAELSRHRLISMQVESQRFVKYDEVTFIMPVWMQKFTEEWYIFEESCNNAELYYRKLIKLNKKPQEARVVLTNATKCDIICTANIREWRYIFKLRTTPENNPQFRELMLDGLTIVKKEYPIFFEDIGD